MNPLTNYIVERIRIDDIKPLFPKFKNAVKNNKITSKSLEVRIRRCIFDDYDDLTKEDIFDLFDQYEIRDWDAFDALQRLVRRNGPNGLWTKDDVTNRNAHELLDDLDADENLFYIMCLAERMKITLVF
jgi:hypothetical protein